jgi:hypothetical protein
MSTPEQPANPPLTRKQMREIRNTGSTPVITANDSVDESADDVADTVAEVEADAEAPADEVTPVSDAETAPDGPPAEEPAPVPPAAVTPIAVAPLARPAEPVSVAPAPVADASVDLGASPLTRRQARQQERIRTASVPVITPELAAAHTAAMAAVATAAPAPALTRDEPVSVHSGMHDLFGLAASPAPARPAVAQAVEEPTADEVDVEADDESPWSPLSPEDESEDERRERVVNPNLGAGLLEAEPEPVELPASFDQLLSRSTGSISMPNALILSQAPEVAPISAPLSATGEVLITGTLNLPEGLGSTGHALGTADGKEVDATLVDGELPAHSSPTPIAASAAISTVKSAGEVIRPPVPEKGSKLMLALAITAGALALALVGVLILAFVTGAL